MRSVVIPDRYKNFLGVPCVVENEISLNDCRHFRLHCIRSGQVFMPKKSSVFVPTAIQEVEGPRFHPTNPMLDLSGNILIIRGFFYEGETFDEKVALVVQKHVTNNSFFEERVRDFFSGAIWKSSPNSV